MTILRPVSVVRAVLSEWLTFLLVMYAVLSKRLYAARNGNLTQVFLFLLKSLITLIVWYLLVTEHDLLYW